MSSMPIGVIKDNPYFAAYCRLTVGAYAKNNLGPNKNNSPSSNVPVNSMNFIDFMKKIEADELVNENYARALPESQIISSKINARFNGNVKFEQNTLSIIEKAYQFGMVNNNNMLISLIC